MSDPTSDWTPHQHLIHLLSTGQIDPLTYARNAGRVGTREEVYALVKKDVGVLVEETVGLSAAVAAPTCAAIPHAAPQKEPSRISFPVIGPMLNMLREKYNTIDVECEVFDPNRLPEHK